MADLPQSPIAPTLKTGFIPAGIERQLYYEDVGDSSLPALLFVHGGPGLGCEEKHRTQFDLRKHRVILYDQRSCGRSQPMGELEENNTQNLIQDIEALRRRLRLEKFTILGSSWGAVLAAGYTASHPERISRLILKSPFLAREEDFLWSYTKNGVAQKLSQDWKKFSQNGLEGTALINFYAEKILCDSPDKEALCRWLNWEGAQYFYSRPHERMDFSAATLNPFWINGTRLQLHFTKNNFFLAADGILTWLQKVKEAGVPALCLQGDLDIITPPSGAELVKQKWPDLELRIVQGADHKIPESVLREI